MGGRKFDVVHTHQAQVADLVDIFQCHFLTRVAYERKCLEARRTLRARAVRLQQQGVLAMEDYFFKRWNPNTEALFCSDLVREEFARLYGAPARQDVVLEMCPRPDAVSTEERMAARQRWIGADVELPVLGFIGGVQERKGYRRVIEAMECESGMFLLIGGSYTGGLELPQLMCPYKSVGMVSDTRSFYAACDIILVPSYFDPCPLVVFEAASRGIPVVTADGVGNTAQVLQYGAGLKWEEGQPLRHIVDEIFRDQAKYRAGAIDMVSELSDGRIERQTLDTWERVLARKSPVQTAAAN
jgi:glycosyltransferase involved in cell wall biosynthesis